jgi:hypothetical protein
MTWRSAFAAAALVAFAVAPGASLVRAASECEATDKIDGSTAAMATKKMEGAGFHDVRDLKKGCDNFWHGIAVKDGIESHVSLTPQGEVMREGD